MLRIHPALPLLLAAVLTPLTGGAAWHCDTMLAAAAPDPDGHVVSSKFLPPAVNGAGHVMVAVRAARVGRRLYRYTAPGIGTVVASNGDLAPTGAVYRRFESSSLNDAGDVAFVASLGGGGRALVELPAAGGALLVARRGDLLPSGGTLSRFLSVSRLAANGDLALVAKVAGGPDGVFRWRRATGMLEVVAVEGDLTDEGRLFCDNAFFSVGLGDDGTVAFRAMTRPSACGGSPSTLRGGVFARQGPAGIVTVARQDLAAPLAGAPYARFFEAPAVDSAGRVTFRAQVDDAAAHVAVFRWDPPATTTPLAARDDTAPGGGTLAAPGPIQATDAGATVFAANVTAGPTARGVFRIAPGAAEAVVTATDVPPDAYPSGGAFSSFLAVASDRSGSWVAFTARAQGAVGPAPGTGVFRCVP